MSLYKERAEALKNMLQTPRKYKNQQLHDTDLCPATLKHSSVLEWNNSNDKH